MFTALISGLVAVIVSIAFNLFINYKAAKNSWLEILSDLRHEKTWTGVWTNEGSVDGSDNEEYVTLYLWCRDGYIDGYMKRNADDSMIFPTFTAITGFKKVAHFYSYSWVSGQRIGKGDGVIQLVNKSNISITDNLNNKYSLFKISSDVEKEAGLH